MKYIILIIIGMAGVVLGTYLGRRRKVQKESKPSDETRGRFFDEAQDKEREDAKKKKGNLEKIRELFAERPRVANDDIEVLLGVSDATATRYLDELEKEGHIRQVGKTGKHVYYEKL